MSIFTIKNREYSYSLTVIHLVHLLGVSNSHRSYWVTIPGEFEGKKLFEVLVTAKKKIFKKYHYISNENGTRKNRERKVLPGA